MATRTLDTLEKTLPRDSYLDGAVFQRELAAVFQPGWICVGRTDRLSEPGDYQALRVGDQSLLIVRDDSNMLRGFYNVCRHRGAELIPLPDTHIQLGQFDRGITCPYHAWSYRLDGTLRGTPHMNIEPGATALHDISVADWGGFVFVCLDNRRGEPLIDALGAAAQRLNNYPLSDLRIGHSITIASTPTGKSFSRITTSATTAALCTLSCARWCLRFDRAVVMSSTGMNWDDGVPHREGANTFTATGTTTRAPFPGLTETEKTHHKGELFYPNLMVSLAMDHVAAFYVWPESASKTHIRCDFLFHPNELDKPDFDPMDAVVFWDLVNQQDWAICESVQRGMQNRVFKHGYYAPMEDYSLDLRRYVLDCLKEAEQTPDIARDIIGTDGNE